MASAIFPEREDVQISNPEYRSETSPRTIRHGRQVNQQFISLVANVGSSVFDAELRDVVGGKEGLAQSHYFPRVRKGSAVDRLDTTGSRNRAAATRSEVSMLRSLPALKKPSTRPRKKQVSNDSMISSQILERPSDQREEAEDPRDEGLSRQGQDNGGQAEIDVGEAYAKEDKELPEPRMAQDPALTLEPTNQELDLAGMLVKILGLKQREDVLAEYSCYLMQSSLLQGTMYILQNHICFYAYLPKQTHAIIKSGFVGKRGRQNPKYNRYWFVLKGEVLSYYKDMAQLYFPRGTIDLRSATSAQLVQAKDNEMESTGFVLKTPQQTYSFRADSLDDAKEWVKRIQSAIFRSQSQGDSIKIVLPIPNILDVEENAIFESTVSFRLRVIDNDETYAIDEYFFTFWGQSEDALKELRAAIERDGKIAADVTDSLEPVQESGPRNDLPESLNMLEKASTPMALSTSRILSEQHTFSPKRQVAHHNFSGIQSHEDTNTLGNVTNFGAAPSPNESRVPDVHTTPRNLLGNVDHTGRSNLSSMTERPPLQSSDSFSKLQDYFKAGAYPLQKASGLAIKLGTESKRVGSLLANESKGYYEKAYTMWAGKKMHYDEGEGPYPRFAGRVDNEQERKHGDRFREHFSLARNEKLQATYYSYLSRVVPVYGKIYVGTSKLCFRSLLPGTRTKMILPLKAIENVVQEKGFRFGYAGLVIGIRGHEEIFFEFRQADARDDCVLTLLENVESVRLLQESRMLTEEELENMESARAEHELLQQARRNSGTSNTEPGTDNDNSPVVFDDPLASLVDCKPSQSLNITCLTIGSRGDVQPFIALCKGLLADGHKPKLATHLEYADWIRGHGVDFAPVAGNPAEIMRLCVEHDMFTVGFIREAHKTFRGFIDELLNSACDACQGADLLIESPSAMAGIHIAEAMQIPYFRAFTMPWTRTRAYPHAFAVPTQKLGGNYNMMTYVAFDNIFWRAMAGQINRWRGKRLGLRNTNLDQMQADKVPFLYNFSPLVVVPPLDFSSWIRITGYWFLDEGMNYEPDSNLVEFIHKARTDNKRLVYVGFGSVVVDRPAELTNSVIEAILQTDVRCILSKGWSDRGAKDTTTVEIPLPDCIFQIQSAPHDWLFRQVDAAAHHGGAGTTGASIRAGIPTIVKPFFGDQYFFGSRVEDLGVGVCLNEITTTGLAQALHKATTNQKMIERARLLGEQIRSENGVQTAIQAIYRDLDYARSLIKRQSAVDEVNDDTEESWTLVGNESDPDVAKQFSGAQGMEFQSSLAQRRQSETGQESLSWANTGPIRNSESTYDDNNEAEEDEDDYDGDEVAEKEKEGED